LFAVYDDSKWEKGSSIRRQPRGYSIVWKVNNDAF
jgi:hypothetical protein